MEHPVIERINRTGYAYKIIEPAGSDFFGNEYFPGETVLELDDEIFVKEHLMLETLEVLQHFGAIEKSA